MRALLLDLNGVLYDNNTPYPGAVAAVSQARALGYRLRYVTNTATRSHQAILSLLEQMGFDPQTNELFTAPLATRHYLMRRGWHAHCLVHPAIAPTFSDLEVGSVSGDEPDCVVLGDAREGLSYDALNRVFRWVRKGKPLIGIGMNRCFREGGQWMLDAGPFIRAIEWAAGIKAEVMGKPSPAFFHELVLSTGLPADQCLMIGDDAEADVAGAMACGLRGCLVRTGKFQADDLTRLPRGAAVIDSIAAWPEQEGRLWSVPDR